MPSPLQMEFTNQLNPTGGMFTPTGEMFTPTGAMFTREHPME